MTPKELYEKLSEKIPPSLSCDWDNDGLSVVSSEKDVKRVLVTLDITKGAVDHAVKKGFDCIVSHHPLLFHPLKALDPDSPSARKAMILFKNGVSAMSFHTRLDAAKNGVNDALAEKLDNVPVTDDPEEKGIALLFSNLIRTRFRKKRNHTKHSGLNDFRFER